MSAVVLTSLIDWAAKILAPVLVCVALLILFIVGLLCERRRRRQKRELDLLAKKAKGLVVVSVALCILKHHAM